MARRAAMPHRCIALGFTLVFFLVVGCNDDPTQPPPGPPSDLLDDEAMQTDPDILAVPADSTFVAWAIANHQPIRSLSSSDFSDLEFLAPLIGSRRLVQLGESGHGVAEFNLAKVRLIRYLHERLGFDVIAFESSIYECFIADREVGTLSAEEVMRNSIFGVWHTEEVLQLFEYLETQRNTARPLTLAGFDVQVSSFRRVQGRPGFLSEVVARVDPVRATEVRFTDSLFVAASTRQPLADFQRFLLAEGDVYWRFYYELVPFFDQHRAALDAAFINDPLVPRIAQRIAVSMPAFIQEIRSYPSPAATTARDQGMADNVTALLTDLYPDRKIMVWAHNFHIEHLHYETSDGIETMGTWIAERHRDDLYSIGLFMYRGTAAWNTRVPYRISPHIRGSMESILYWVRRKHFLIDMLHTQPSAGNSWMFQFTRAKTWGFNDYILVPRDQYDAILFVDTVTPPAYHTFPPAAEALPAEPAAGLGAMVPASSSPPGCGTLEHH